MTLDERAASLTHEEIKQLLVTHEQVCASHEELRTRFEAMRQQLDWLKRQLFGRRSERRLVDLPEGARQLSFGELPELAPPSAEATVTVPAHRRRKKAVREESETALRFGDDVEVQEIVLPPPVGEDEPYRVIGEKVTHRLAQRPVPYVVLRFRRPLVKRLRDGKVFCAPAPAGVLGRSFADVSLVAGVAIEKFRYHLPLYRQEQRLAAAGIRVSRATLCRMLQQAAELLAPVYEAQKRSVLSSAVLTMDETPIRAGRIRRGKMRQGWLWPMWGDRREVVFPYASTRAHRVVGELLEGYSGKLLTDGYAGYAVFAESTEKLIHAQCWVHARRYFVRAREMEPELCDRALEWIGRLYELEKRFRAEGLEGEALLTARGEQARPVVDGFLGWLERERDARLLLPSNPFVKAADYVLSRREALKVFLEHPDVPLDTNHLEQQIRPIALGRKNWLFCWTELGTRTLTVLQSLITTCRLQGIDPRTYLIDVLQRIECHPMSEVEKLTPRLWKEHFAAEPLGSWVDRPCRPDASA